MDHDGRRITRLMQDLAKWVGDSEQLKSTISDRPQIREEFLLFKIWGVQSGFQLNQKRMH